MKKRSVMLSIAFVAPFIVFAQLADSATRLVHMQGAVNFRDAGGSRSSAPADRRRHAHPDQRCTGSIRF